MRLVPPFLMITGCLVVAAALYALAVSLPLGTIEVTGALDEQTAFIIKGQWASFAGSILNAGLLVVLIGILLRRDGGKP